MQRTSLLCILVALAAAPRAEPQTSIPSSQCPSIEGLTLTPIDGVYVLGREFHSSVVQYVNDGTDENPVYTERIITFGGRNSEEALNVTSIFNPLTGNTTTEVLTVGAEPIEPRWGHSAVWTGIGMSDIPEWATKKTFQGIKRSPDQFVTHFGHVNRMPVDTATGNIENEGTVQEGGCIGDGLKTHVDSQAAGGICTRDARGCGCLAITVTSLNETGLPEADVPTPGGAAPSLWSGWVLKITQGPGEGYSGIISWSVGNRYNVIPRLHVMPTDRSRFVITQPTPPPPPIPQDTMWVFGGYLGDGSVSGETWAMSTSQKGETVAGASDLIVSKVERFSPPYDENSWAVLPPPHPPLVVGPAGTTYCGGAGHILGPVSGGGLGELRKDYVVGAWHDSVLVEFEFVRLDYWGGDPQNQTGDDALLYVDGQEVWRMGFNLSSSLPNLSRDTSNPGSGGNNLCGDVDYADEVIKASVTAPHTSQSLRLSFTSTSETRSGNSTDHPGYFGIRSVSVRSLPLARSWRKVNTTGASSPSPRAHHAASLSLGAIYIFGGTSASSPPLSPGGGLANERLGVPLAADTKLGDTWRFDAAAETWGPMLFQVPAGKNLSLPSPRSHHSMDTGPGDSIVMYGGQGDTGILYGDVWILHTGAGGRTGEWIKPVVYGNVPEPRAAHASAVSGMRFFIMGGQVQDAISGNIRPDYSVYALHLSSLTWASAASLPAEMGPFRRFGHQTVSLKDGAMIVVGGAYAPKSNASDGLVPVNVSLMSDASSFGWKCQPPPERGPLHASMLRCAGIEELEWVDLQLQNLKVTAVDRIYRLEMELTDAARAQARYVEQHNTDIGWFDTVVQRNINLVTDFVNQGKIYTDEVAYLQGARTARYQAELWYRQVKSSLDSRIENLKISIDQAKIDFSRAIETLEEQGLVIARAKVEGTVSAGTHHSCAINADDYAKCWGLNDIYQSNPPTAKFLAIAAGDHQSCAIRVDNRRLMCWGSDTFGKSTPPKDVQFRQISSGNTFSCGISLDGSLYCWGDDRQGQSSPPPGKYTLVSCGFEHACALRVPKGYENKAGSTTEGEAVCWGNYADGRVNAPKNGIFKWVSAGGRHSCAVKRDGKMTCWGGDKHGQVRHPTEVYYKTVSCGHTHSCAIKANGDLVCWGGNAHGQTVVPKKKRFKTVSAGWSHTCAIDALRNNVICWGQSRTDPKTGKSATETPTSVSTCTRVWV